MFEPGVERSRHFSVALAARLRWARTLHNRCAGIPLVGRRSCLSCSRARMLAALHALFSTGGEEEQSSGWFLATALISFQILFWVAIFAIARYQYLKALAQ